MLICFITSDIVHHSRTTTMLYCSIDIETTGLNPKTCDIVQFAAVLDNLADPQPLD